jgi:hypothetical protein
MDIISYIENCRQTMGGAHQIEPFLNDKIQLKNLINVACSKLEHPYPAYAAWIVSNISKKNTELLVEFQPQLIDTILSSNNQSVLRNCVQSLNNLPISNYKEGELLDRLIGFIQDDSNKVALFVYSIYLLAKFTRKYPAIKQEIQVIIDSKPLIQQPAMRVGIRNYLSLTADIL